MEKDALTSARLRGSVSLGSVYMYPLNVHGTPPVVLTQGQRSRPSSEQGWRLPSGLVKGKGPFSVPLAFGVSAQTMLSPSADGQSGHVWLGRVGAMAGGHESLLRVFHLHQNTINRYFLNFETTVT